MSDAAILPVESARGLTPGSAGRTFVATTHVETKYWTASENDWMHPSGMALLVPDYAA